MSRLVVRNAEAVAAAGEPGGPVRARSNSSYRALTLALAALRIGPLAILGLLIVVLSVLSDVFLSFENVGNVMKQSAVICISASGSCWSS